MSPLALLFSLFDRSGPQKDGTFRLRDGDSALVSVRGGIVIAHTFDVALSHAEFIRRQFGQLPEGAWVGTIRKIGRRVIALNSKTFYDNQLPAEPAVQDAVRLMFR
jgi:hypothetical protein